MQPDRRDKKPLDSELTDILIDRLTKRLHGIQFDGEAFEAVLVFAKAHGNALKDGFTDPLTFNQSQHFLCSKEISALRHALLSNKELLKEYSRRRGLQFVSNPKEKIYADGKIGWQRAAALSCETHASLAPELGKTAQSVFTRGLIEAHPGKGTPNNVVLASAVYPPFVFMSFNGSLFDCQELCHLVGHAVHGLRRNTEKKLKPFSSTAIDEILPDLEERVFWDSLSRSGDFNDEIATQGLDNFAGYISRFAAIDEFQQVAAALFAQKTRLDVRHLDHAWVNIQQDWFGDAAVSVGSWRTMRFISDHPFGALPHIYAQLVAEYLWHEYERDRVSFAHKFLAFIDEGNARPPRELLEPLGIDTTDVNFWSNAFSDIRKAVGTFSSPGKPAPR
jgi:oligoendopeptidase F